MEICILYIEFECKFRFSCRLNFLFLFSRMFAYTINQSNGENAKRRKKYYRKTHSFDCITTIFRKKLQMGNGKMENYTNVYNLSIWWSIDNKALFIECNKNSLLHCYTSLLYIIKIFYEKTIKYHHFWYTIIS